MWMAKDTRGAIHVDPRPQPRRPGGARHVLQKNILVVVAATSPHEDHRAHADQGQGRDRQGEEGRNEGKGDAQKPQLGVRGGKVPVAAQVLEIVVLVLHVPVDPAARTSHGVMPQPRPQHEQHDGAQRCHRHEGQRNARESQVQEVASAHPQVMGQQEDGHQPGVVFGGQRQTPDGAAQKTPARRAQRLPVGQRHQHGHHDDGHIETRDLCVKEVVGLGHGKHGGDRGRDGTKKAPGQPVDQCDAQAGKQDGRKAKSTRLAFEQGKGQVAAGDGNGMKAALGHAVASVEQPPRNAVQNLHQGWVLVVVLPDPVDARPGKGTAGMSAA